MPGRKPLNNAPRNPNTGPLAFCARGYEPLNNAPTLQLYLVETLNKRGASTISD